MPGKIWVHGVPVSVPAGVFPAHHEPRTLVRFSGPVRADWLRALSERSIRVEFWCPPQGACLRCPITFLPEQLREFPFLEGAVPYTEELCRREIPASFSGSPDDLVDVVCFGRNRRGDVESQLTAMGIPIVDRSSSKLRIRYQGDLGAIRDLNGVKIANRARQSVLLGTAGLAVGTGGIAGEWVPGLDGSGEIIAVADSGLDVGGLDTALHPDFQGRVDAVFSWPINAAWDGYVVSPGHDDGAEDISGHGTHVAGCALGSGALSKGSRRGAAPAARLVVQAIEQYTEMKPEFRGSMHSGYYLNGRPLDLRELFQQARDLGARIHINAWGDATRGVYTDDCFEADLFLNEHPDAMVIFAAGNDGEDRNADGLIDRGTVYAPGCAKNVLTIGATEGPYAAGQPRTWGELDPKRLHYRNPADRADRISGEMDRIALFSSAGPTADGRIKPDVCAPGTNIVATRSQASTDWLWGYADPLPFYAYYGGTSVSAGIAGGIAAVVRQAWREHLGAALSGAALKTALVLGAQPVRGRGAGARAPVDAAGFGRLNIAASLPVQPGLSIRLVEETGGLNTGDERRFELTVSRTGAVRAVLAWYDLPGERIINDLDLCLITEAGHEIWANGFAGSNVPDRVNTVEVLSVEALRAGCYTLRVSAANVPAGPQPFAMIYSYAS